MNNDVPAAGRDRLLRLWLAVLVAVAALATVQALMLPRWPRSPILPTASLSSALAKTGLNPKALATLPASRSYERSLSRVLGWKLSGGTQLRLVHGSARQRKTFQAAFFGRDQPVLALVSRRLQSPMAGSAAGLIQGRPAYQTCLVLETGPPAALEVTAEALGKAADQRVAGRFETIKGLVGLQLTRSFDCILVTLRSDSSQPPSIAVWRRALAAVSTSLQEETRRWH